MMTKVSPLVQAFLKEFTEHSQEVLQRHPAAIDTLLSWGISHDSIKDYNLGYNPRCFLETIEGNEVKIFDGITIPVVDCNSDCSQLLDVCCKPINIIKHSLYVCASSSAIFESSRGIANENTVFVIVDEPIDAIMIESQLDLPLHTYVLALGSGAKRIHDVNLKAKLAAGSHILVALNNTNTGDTNSEKLIHDLRGTGKASRLRPLHKSPLLDWITGIEPNAWVGWALIGMGFNLPDPDAAAVAAESKEYWKAVYAAEAEANAELYSELAPYTL